MINKETITDCLELISIAAGLTLSDKDIERKIILFSHPEIFGEYEDNDFKKATIEIIKNETFYNKIPQPVTFREYCQKEKDKRINALKSQEAIKIELDMENVTKSIIDYLDLKANNTLYHYVKNELKNQNKDKIREAFKKLKDKEDATPDDWRRELNKKEVTKEAKNWVIPNLKADR